MPLGTRNVHINTALSDFALMFSQDKAGYIANALIPPIQVKKLSDSYFTFDRTNWRSVTDTQRGPTSKSNRANVPSPSNTTYNIIEYALHDLVSNAEIEEADEPLKPKQDTTGFVTEQLMISKEIQAAGLMFVTAAVANYTSLTTGSQWGYTSTTTPLNDIDTGIDTVKKAIGKSPNMATMGEEVYTKLKRHAQLLDIVKYTQKGILTAELVAAAINLDMINVGSAVYMSTNEGCTSESTSFIWGKNVLINYVAKDNAAKKVLSHAYQFTKSNGEIEVREWNDEPADSVAIEVRMRHDMKITCSLCGYTIFGAVA